MLSFIAFVAVFRTGGKSEQVEEGALFVSNNHDNELQEYVCDRSLICHFICFLQRRSETRGVLQSQPAAEGAKQIPAGHHQSPGGKVASSTAG